MSFYLPANFVENHNELDQFLVQQKDEIIEMIDNGETDKALAVLRVLRPMWIRLGYEYKPAELERRAALQCDLETTFGN